jgi:hypothetical protein
MMEKGNRDRRRVVVDGSNIATEGRTTPSLAQLDEAIRSFLEEFPGFTSSDVIVVVDATFGHRIDPSELRAFEQAVDHSEMITPPAGAIGRGDGFILRIAEKSGALVLSNDSFQEFHAERPWLFEPGRLIGGKPVPGVGWVFTPRTPVRGARSRSVTSRAKRDATVDPDDLAADVDGDGSPPAVPATSVRRAHAGKVNDAAGYTGGTKATKATKATKGAKGDHGDTSDKSDKSAKAAKKADKAAKSDKAAKPGKSADKAAKSTKAAHKAAKADKADKSAKADESTAKAPSTTRAPRADKAQKTVKKAAAKKTAAEKTAHDRSGGTSSAGSSRTAKANNGSAPAKSTRKAAAKSSEPAVAVGNNHVAASDALNDPVSFLTFVADHPVGSTFEGTVTAFTSHGAHVSVDGMLCHIPLRGLASPPPNRARQVLTKGETRPFVLISLDAARRRAELALPGVRD